MSLPRELIAIPLARRLRSTAIEILGEGSSIDGYCWLDRVSARVVGYSEVGNCSFDSVCELCARFPRIGGFEICQSDLRPISRTTLETSSLLMGVCQLCVGFPL